MMTEGLLPRYDFAEKLLFVQVPAAQSLRPAFRRPTSLYTREALCGAKPHTARYTHQVYRSAPLYLFDKLEFIALTV